LGDVLGALAPLAVLDADWLYEVLAPLVQNANYLEGSPYDQRAREVAALDEQLAANERDHAAAVDAVTKATAGLEHLPNTVAARLRGEREKDAYARDQAVNESYYKAHPAERPRTPEPAP
jgi:hypothetical protein